MREPQDYPLLTCKLWYNNLGLPKVLSLPSLHSLKDSNSVEALIWAFLVFSSSTVAQKAGSRVGFLVSLEVGG